MDQRSRDRLETCHDDLKRLALAVDEVYPIQVICGARGEKEQNEAFEKGTSKKKFPESKHNINKEKGRFKSHALDAVPDPDKNPKTLDWKDINAFAIMCEVFQQKADELGIKIRQGKDFKFRDWPHQELV